MFADYHHSAVLAAGPSFAVEHTVDISSPNPSQPDCKDAAAAVLMLDSVGRRGFLMFGLDKLAALWNNLSELVKLTVTGLRLWFIHFCILRGGPLKHPDQINNKPGVMFREPHEI